MKSASGQTPRPQALIIDDTAVVRSFLTEALNEKGFDVITAVDGLTGIEMATQSRPSLVFCDTYMPDIDGYETVKRLRQILPSTVLVMTNSLPNAEQDARGVVGVDYVLDKPFGLDELWNILEEIRRKLRVGVSFSD